MSLAVNDPMALETLYREHPRQFLRWLTQALSDAPDEITLRVWDATLNYTKARQGNSRQSKLIFVILGSLVAYALYKIPDFMPVSAEWFYVSFAMPLIVGPLLCYFLLFWTVVAAQVDDWVRIPSDHTHTAIHCVK